MNNNVVNLNGCDGPRLRTMPHNIEAEKSLFGAIFIEDRATIIEAVSGYLKPEHFSYEPHGRIYQAVLDITGRGQIANPVTLKRFFETNDALTGIGGAGYLAELAACAVTPINAREYARMVFDLWRRRELIASCQETADRAYEAEDETDSILEQHEAALAVAADIDAGENGVKPISHFTEQAIATAEAARAAGGVVGVPSGLTDLDRLLGGFHNTDLIILAGRPSMGKTALANNIGFNAARNGIGVLGFSIEMSGEQLALREIGSESGVSSHRLRLGSVNPMDLDKAKDAGERIGKLPFYVDDHPTPTVQAIRSTARREKRRHDIGLVIVDYLQLITSGGASRNEGRVQEVSAITRGLKALAKELNVPVLALSQLNREVEQRKPPRPQLSDLRESGSIEQDADAVLLIFREEYYHDRDKPDAAAIEKFARWQAKKYEIENTAEVIVAKQRHGPTGTTNLRFNPARTRFETLAPGAP